MISRHSYDTFAAGGRADCSRNGHHFKAWPQLSEEMAGALRYASAVLDGQVCCLEPDGRTNFYRLMFRRDRPFFYAFDVLAIARRWTGAVSCSRLGATSTSGNRQRSGQNSACCKGAKFDELDHIGTLVLQYSTSTQLSIQQW
jgi:hypothetical protein